MFNYIEETEEASSESHSAERMAHSGKKDIRGEKKVLRCSSAAVLPFGIYCSTAAFPHFGTFL